MGVGAALLVLLPLVAAAEAAELVWPGKTWASRPPEAVGLDRLKLDALRNLVGGSGVVIRHGYLAYSWDDVAKSSDVASAVKPVISTLLLIAVQEGKLCGVDDPVSNFEPLLKELNGGKDAGITWRHLAMQTSGYGLAEPPGAAYAYNDYALALYYDTLTRKVFQDAGTNVLKTRLGDVLGFEDAYTFEAFGATDRPGRLAISVRDFARFGLLYLRGGRWRERQVVRPELIRLAVSSALPTDLPVTTARDADMLPGQRTLGGGKNITRVGPGYYSFNWWLNSTDRAHRRLFVDAPADALVASGHGGKRMLWIIPSLDLLVCWNDADVADHDMSPGNPDTRCNRAARLMRAAGRTPAGPVDSALQPRTCVAILDGRWHINGRVTYPASKAEGLLMNVRMVNAVFEDRARPEFDPEANTDEFLAKVPDYAAHGVRAFTLSLQGGMPGYEGAVNSAFEPDGTLRASYFKRIRRVIEACDRHGVVIILGCYYQRQDHVLKDEAAVKAGVVNVARWIADYGFPNVMLEIANEFSHPGFDHRILRSPEGQAELIRLAKKTAPGLLVSTSGIGDGKLPDVVAEASDFLLIHFNGVTVEAIPERIRALQKFRKPIVCNEDAKTGEAAARAAEASVNNGASWGLMLEKLNQHFPFTFKGAEDDPVVYGRLKQLTTQPH
ncbi:MAG: serine hydrolase [Planctomycetes bacterium]|nr:serine hydrolase [Planctomycetota bacterium]